MTYREASFYGFGLGTAVRGLFANPPAFAASALLQPVNSYTRFPEYFFFWRALSGLQGGPEGRRPRILDLGSPKLFGLSLAARRPFDLVLTDIHPSNVLPYERLWRATARRARGTASFRLLDARRIEAPDGAFDAAYAMSVLEHIEGGGQDTAAALEMLRVVAPGGLIVFSVPFGPRAQDQDIFGLAGAVVKTRRAERHFFQRIYDPETFAARLAGPLRGAIEAVETITAFRAGGAALRAFHRIRGRLPLWATAALGPFNPCLSAAFNRHRPGAFAGFAVSYGRIHSYGDVYGDLVFVARKKGSRPT